MALTAEQLRQVPGRTIVLTGAMQPARMRRTDAVFNLGFAWAALQLLPPGVYIAMNGEVFEAGKVRKNLQAQKFEVAP
jgi:L-asparaginase